jgi:hypothetical protein
MDYEYLLLLRQTVTILAFQMPDMLQLFLARLTYFNFYSRRIAPNLPFIVAGLLRLSKQILHNYSSILFILKMITHSIWLLFVENDNPSRQASYRGRIRADKI